MNVRDLKAKLTALRAGEISPREIYQLLHDFGDSNFRSAEADIARYLHNPKSSLRYVAVMVLGFHWRLPRYRSEFEKLVERDSDVSVRRASGAALGYILSGSANKRTSSILLRKLADEREDESVRLTAYEALLHIWSKRFPQARRARRGIWVLEDTNLTLRRIDLLIDVLKSRRKNRPRKIAKLNTVARDADGVIRHVDWKLVATIAVQVASSGPEGGSEKTSRMA